MSEATESKNRILELLEERDLSRYALAKATGISENSIGNLIKKGISIDKMYHGNVVDIAAALGVDVDELRSADDWRPEPAKLTTAA